MALVGMVLGVRPASNQHATSPHLGSEVMVGEACQAKHLASQGCCQHCILRAFDVLALSTCSGPVQPPVRALQAASA